jgi:hypothetical protein
VQRQALDIAVQFIALAVSAILGLLAPSLSEKSARDV